MIKLFSNFNIGLLKKALKLLGKRSKVFLIFIGLFCLVEILCSVASTFGLRGIINSLDEKNLRLIFVYFAIYIGQNILWWVCIPVSNYMSVRAYHNALLERQVGMYDHILNLPLKAFNDIEAGDILAMFTNDFDCLKNFYSRNFAMVFSTFINGLGGLILMLLINWQFALVVFGFGTLSIFISSKFSKKVKESSDKRQNQLGKVSANIYELIRAFKTINLLNISNNRYKVFSQVVNEEIELEKIKGKTIAIMNATVTVINMLSYVLILFIGILFVHYRVSDWGTVIALLNLKGITDLLFVEFSKHLSQMQVNLAGVQRILNFANMDEEESELTRYYLKGAGDILSLENISFSYGNGVTPLQNYNLSLKKNSLNVLCGHSGIGKSTVLKLILALFKPQEGKISFNTGHHKEKPTLERIRQQTAYVMQKPLLFRGTIKENLTCGRKIAESKIREIAKKVVIEDFINELDGGYNTELLDYGVGLSGGQKQRIALARALLSDAPLLLLDEITSDLDDETEDRIITTIKSLSSERTILFVTHKEKVAKIADYVHYV